jgi:hypothetical protein
MSSCDPRVGRVVHYVEATGECVAAVIIRTAGIIDPGVKLRVLDGVGGDRCIRVALQDAGRAPTTWHHPSQD